MDPITSHDWKLLMLTGVLVSLLAWPGSSEAQTVTGQASAVQATVFGALGLGTTTALSDTGTLGGTRDAREASLVTGAVPSLLTGEALHAVTIGWPDQVASEASLGSLALTVAGTGISADSVMARALAVLGSAGTGRTDITGLSINGIPILPTGSPNQTIAIPGGRVVIDEQISSVGASVVNALHVVVDGVADVVIASAKAGIF
ncbi:MAG: hypothetical protein E6K57_02020 [Nitrospirae bacterium]|nr:MAG: hypothetical protein E6K57_02020 [Nitrospirota bacterium]